MYNFVSRRTFRKEGFTLAFREIYLQNQFFYFLNVPLSRSILELRDLSALSVLSYQQVFPLDF